MTTRRMLRRAAGFTLLEMMIAGVIVAMLAVIALPSYSRYVLRSNRAVARAALISLAAKQEVRKLQQQAYAASSFKDLIGLDQASYYINRSGLIEASSAADSIYLISLASAPVSSASCGSSGAGAEYQLIATPVAGSPQARDTDCSALCISSTGLRGSGPKGTAVCWVQ